MTLRPPKRLTSTLCTYFRQQLTILVTWLVVLGFQALVDSMSVYIGLTPREGKRISVQPSFTLTASAVGPCPTIIQISRTHIQTSRIVLCETSNYLEQVAWFPIIDLVDISCPWVATDARDRMNRIEYVVSW